MKRDPMPEPDGPELDSEREPRHRPRKIQPSCYQPSPLLPAEAAATAWLLAIAAVLIAASVLSSRLSARSGIPVFLVFIGLGILAGSEGIGGIEFTDYHLSFRLGTVALALILFDGGLNTRLSVMRPAMTPAIVLATVGVIGTALVVALGGRLVGFSWAGALLLGAVVSSTDAAAVFSVLRGSNLHLRRRVAATLELESGLNDPLAVILTATMTQVLATSGSPGWGLLAAPRSQISRFPTERW